MACQLQQKYLLTTARATLKGKKKFKQCYIERYFVAQEHGNKAYCQWKTIKESPIPIKCGTTAYPL